MSQTTHALASPKYFLYILWMNKTGHQSHLLDLLTPSFAQIYASGHPVTQLADYRSVRIVEVNYTHQSCELLNDLVSNLL